MSNENMAETLDEADTIIDNLLRALKLQELKIKKYKLIIAELISKGASE